MIQVNVHEPKSQLSKLIEAVLSGQRVTIARAGKPAVDLVAHRPTDVVFGVAEWRGWRVDADALDAHDEEIEEMFYGANP